MTWTPFDAHRPDGSESAFPSAGRPADDLLAEVRTLRRDDLAWRDGHAFGLVYDADDAELDRVLEGVAAELLHENALNPFRYRTLLKMETEVVDAAKALFGGSAATLTSGGSESIFLAVAGARAWARDRGIADPTLLCTDTAHPAFAKACAYLGVEMVRLPHGPDGRAVPEAYERAVDRRTALLVASAPCYPFGVIDPITDIAAVALERDRLCHVDACLGGWLLPWWERLGQPVPPWDFRVDGVTSLSADVHKYGYTFKGASTLLHRDADLAGHLVFLYDDWPGGLYASSTAAGTRPGPPIAGAWAAIMHLGAAGYLRLAARVLDATRRMTEGIRAIDGLGITSDPDLSIFEISSTTVDLAAVGDRMEERGWSLDRQPGGLHLTLSPGHDRVVDEFLDDLARAVAAPGASRGAGAVYGGIAPT